MRHPDDPLTHVLVSDLDDTLLGDDPALEALARQARDEWPFLGFVYASGRTPESMLESVRTTPLPDPLALIGNVGTAIRTFPENELLEEWPRDYAPNWNAARIMELLAHLPRLTPQEPASQSPYKVSYYLENASQGELDAILEVLRTDGLAAELVYSSNRDLDLLPEGIDKGAAATYYVRRLGLPADAAVVSGNSMNDASLFEQGFAGIVVGNAHDELKDFGREREAYIAEAGYAAGVMEGLKRLLSLKDAI